MRSRVFGTNDNVVLPCPGIHNVLGEFGIDKCLKPGRHDGQIVAVVAAVISRMKLSPHAKDGNATVAVRGRPIQSRLQPVAQNASDSTVLVPLK